MNRESLFVHLLATFVHRFWFFLYPRHRGQIYQVADSLKYRTVYQKPLSFVLDIQTCVVVIFSGQADRCVQVG